MTILPDLMQLVQTLTRLGAPFTSARTRWMFGFQRRFVRRCEWLTFMPKLGCFPQISHTAAMTRYLGAMGVAATAVVPPMEIQELDDGKVGRVVASCEDTALEGSLNIWACVNVRDCCDATNLIDCMP